MQTVTTYRARRSRAALDVLRRGARDAAIFGLSLTRSIPTSSDWIRFPYYHHVFDDERAGFEAQLRYLRNFGDFISLDDAAVYLDADPPPAGRYFCVTFDDGFRNHLANAVPILVAARACAAFFVPTGFIGASSEEAARLGYYGRLSSPPVEMMTWDDCRRLQGAGMIVGSHGVSHARLRDLETAEAEREMRESKAAIERALGIACRHFCAPYGMPGADFDPDRDPRLAREAGYRTFLTTARGSLRRPPSPLAIERDQAVAAWPPYQLRYFFSR
ncbi:MAG: polysaccharide deacetylase family protein [Acidobacteria bacterium]|nr:polysaccharide deacetylase family protein [Acidobacteriota bacterium]